uniref:UTP--glucose-1-phosphate uridylyltransferase n=1 Tax=Haemonchus contortus TaxID=6289 RepID=A0A7I4YRQ7_HAECO
MHVSAEKKAELLQKLDEFFERNKHKVTNTDAEVFRRLYKQLLEETPHIDWNSWKFISDNVQRSYDDLPNFVPTRTDILDRLVVVKLNGGLGTTMGCAGPKSFIKVKKGLSFLDIARQQHEAFNHLHKSSVPLYLMNSFYTDQLTAQELGSDSDVKTFCQSRCPRIYANTLLPVEQDGSDQEWYPPGHGNIFQSLEMTGVLDELLRQGRDIMFVSNIDNTGATLDLKIAQFACDEAAEYIMECTAKTENDIKGGTLIDIGGQLMHLEIPQVPPEHLDEFCSTRTFKIFNTNNIWVNLRAVKQRLDTISSEIIVNKKILNGRPVIQLETSIGGCIRNFPRAYCVHVDRCRFLPVKKVDDLLAISSNLYTLNDARALQLSRSRPAPTVELGSFFQRVDEFHSRFDDYPDMQDLDSLKIEGDVRFEKGVVLKGKVSIVNRASKQQTISSGTVIENKQLVFE